MSGGLCMAVGTTGVIDHTRLATGRGLLTLFHMVSICRRFIFVALIWAMGLEASAAGRLPPIDGEFSGRFAALKIAGAPVLRWTVRVRTIKTDERVVDVSIDGEGTRLRARASVSEAGEGWWRMEEGTLDAAAWFPAVSTQVGEMAMGVAASGTIEVRGSGTLRGWEADGAVTVGWREGMLRHEADGWALEGIAVSGEFLIDAVGGGLKGAGPVELVVRTISTARFGARNFFASAVLNEDRTLTLKEAKIEVAGGEVTVDEATLPLDPLEFDFNLRVTNVGLQDVAALVPAGLSESRGRINGAVRVGWSEEDGFQLGAGNLVLSQAEEAMVRLAPAPGFLTDQVPARFELLPAWMGPVARWFRPENPAYADMRGIELGETALRLEALSVQLTPEGDREGRTARVKVTARPARAGGVVEVVTFEVNVAGPLGEVLRLGMNQSFSVDAR